MNRPTRAIISPDIHGEPLFSEAQYIANAAQVGSVGRGVATSGFDVAGSYVELNAGLTYRTSWAVNNQGADTVFIGPSGAGLAGMYPVAGSGGQINLNITSGVRMYGITDGTTTNVRIIEIG